MVAAFEVTVDTLMALRINASDVASLFDTISNSSSVPDVISATVFRYTQKDMPASLTPSVWTKVLNWATDFSSPQQPYTQPSPCIVLWMHLQLIQRSSQERKYVPAEQATDLKQCM